MKYFGKRFFDDTEIVVRLSDLEEPAMKWMATCDGIDGDLTGFGETPLWACQDLASKVYAYCDMLKAQMMRYMSGDRTPFVKTA